MSYLTFASVLAGYLFGIASVTLGPGRRPPPTCCPTASPSTPSGASPTSTATAWRWIFSGLMDHADTEGHQTTIRPGLAQRSSAGTGVMHTEHNSSDGPSHGVQMWVLPDRAVAPSYAQADISADLGTGQLVPWVPGRVGDVCGRRGGLRAARWSSGATVGSPGGSPGAAAPPPALSLG